MADGFLGRWSQRKQAVREGRPLQEPAVPAADPGDGAATPHSIKPATRVLAPGAAGHAVVSDATAQAVVDGAAPATPGSPTEPAPPLTLQDAAALGTESDYAPFVARGVAPEVRNAAMKKLFTDPHYNVMDRLDTYIDDYSLPDPLPASMLRQMASAKFLKLFDDEPKASPAVAPSPQPGPESEPEPDAGTKASAEAAAASAPELVSPPPEPEDDHTDLRLQPNHAAGRETSGRGAQ